MFAGNAAVIVRPVQIIGGIRARRNDFKQVSTHGVGDGLRYALCSAGGGEIHYQRFARSRYRAGASEEAAALDAASLKAATDDAAEEATEELLTLLAELPEQEASSRAAADAPATCKNWRREILFFIRNTPLSM